MYEEAKDKKKQLYWIIGGLAVVLAGAVVTAVLFSGGKGGEDILPSQSESIAQTTEDAKDTEPTGTTPEATEGQNSTDPTDPTDATTGKNETPGKTDGNQQEHEPDPTEASPEPVTPVQPQPTEPTEPKEPTVGVDTETTPPKADNVIDFDDLINAGKNNG